MHSALTRLAQKVKLAVETVDKETWQGLVAELQRRNKSKERNKEMKMKLNNTDHKEKKTNLNIKK